jgi:hypothetical protein
MSRTKPSAAATVAAPTDTGAADQPAALHPIFPALARHAVAMAAVVKFPSSPVPPALIERLDQATQGVLAAAAMGGAEGVPAPSVNLGGVEDRLARLEAFADRVSGDLPARLSAIEEKVEAALPAAGEKAAAEGQD